MKQEEKGENKMDANNPPKENKNVAANTGSGTKNAQNEKRNNWLIPVFVIISFAVLHVSCLVAWAASVIYSLSACTCEATYYACTCDGKNYIIPICATVLAVAGMICCAVLISKFMIASKKEKEQVSEKMLDLFEKVYLNTKNDTPIENNMQSNKEPTKQEGKLSTTRVSIVNNISNCSCNRKKRK